VSQNNALIRIAIIDDHPLFRTGLRRVLERSGDMSVEWELADTAGLEAAFSRNSVDLILMDVEFAHGRNGLEATRTALARWPDLDVIILSGSLDPEMPRLALDCGATGFLAKDTPIPEMIFRIRELAFGGRRRGRLAARTGRACSHGAPLVLGLGWTARQPLLGSRVAACFSPACSRLVAAFGQSGHLGSENPGPLSGPKECNGRRGSVPGRGSAARGPLAGRFPLARH